MKYDIYFHNDFDGRASAAVMLNFLRSRADTVAGFYPVNYPVPKNWMRLNFFSARNSLGGGKYPAVVVDYRYHPKAAFWFDHHPTTFLTQSWQRAFKPTKQHHWEPASFSCCRQVIEALKKDFQYKPPKHIVELGRWLDVVDGALYKSARQTIAMKEPALQLNEYIEQESKKGRSLEWLIELLSQKRLEDIVALPKIAKVVATIRARREKSLAFYKKNISLCGNTSFIDISKDPIDDLRFAPFFLHPKTLYNITQKKKPGCLHLTVGVNPWRKEYSKKHIGELLKTYGGGGHKNVGGVELKGEKRLAQVAQEIITFLNS